jgi:ATP-dependent DNA helicase DinG
MANRLQKYLSPAAIDSIRQHISEAEGNEVFLVGNVDEQRLVASVEVFARGNETSAPALLQVARQGNVVIHNHPSGTLHPSGADMHVASILGNDGVGFYIVNNPVSDVYVVIEPFTEKKTIPVDPQSLIEAIAEDGPISKKLESYEFRPQQIEMIATISRAINEDKIAVVEAGTGTGKTLAYLLPAIQYAVQNRERIVVSTNTINLQEQLIHKDLPFLASILDQKFKAVLVKGRSNYGCKRKLAEAEQEIDLFSEEGERAELQGIIDWAKATKDGSKSDLNVEPRSDVWEKIQSESDTSLKARCPFYNECFFYSARRQAAGADILVANHHLLFSDLALRATFGASENAVLPAYDRIIFDEAHNVEDAATNYFGDAITYLGLQRILHRLYRRKADQEKGLLTFLSNKLMKFAGGLPHEKFLASQQFIQEEAIRGVDSLNFLLVESFEQIYFLLLRQSESEFGEVKQRLTATFAAHPNWQNEVLMRVKKLVLEMRKFTGRMDKFLQEVENFRHKLGPNVISLTVDLQAQCDRLDAAASTIEKILLIEDDADIRWIEVREGYKQSKVVRLRSAPLEVAGILKDHVYAKFKNVVMTSATLTVERRFDFLKNRLGLDLLEPAQIIEQALPAPFDYERQTLVAAPTDISDPKQSQFVNELQRFILPAIEISRGRAFVLFTAYGLLNVLYNRLKPEIEKLGYNVYRQGQENRHRLLERFKHDVSSVLFATDSFWEGVDVHGEALELVIITKLPFKVPSEPIIEARVEAIERRGGNAFLEFSLPQAAIKFRQGFGRLIRRKSDRGAVLILDNRVMTKRYGRIFLNSLPKCNIVAGPSTEIFDAMRIFFSSTGIHEE